ncbi:MAG: hypothetical protein WAK17_08650 [Candidatus Nitrosopolaris sp.]
MKTLDQISSIYDSYLPLWLLFNWLRERQFVVGIMGTKFRNRLKRYNNASDIVSGLVNLRVMQSNRISL